MAAFTASSLAGSMLAQLFISLSQPPIGPHQPASTLVTPFLGPQLLGLSPHPVQLS